MATSKTIEGLYEVGPDQKLQVKQPIWKSLFFQIGVAIVLGITIVVNSFKSYAKSEKNSEKASA